jgi:hypothetical protein
VSAKTRRRSPPPWLSSRIVWFGIRSHFDRSCQRHPAPVFRRHLDRCCASSIIGPRCWGIFWRDRSCGSSIRAVNSAANIGPKPTSVGSKQRNRRSSLIKPIGNKRRSRKALRVSNLKKGRSAVRQPSPKPPRPVNRATLGRTAVPLAPRPVLSGILRKTNVLKHC